MYSVVGRIPDLGRVIRATILSLEPQLVSDRSSEIPTIDIHPHMDLDSITIYAQSSACRLLASPAAALTR